MKDSATLAVGLGAVAALGIAGYALLKKGHPAVVVAPAPTPKPVDPSTNPPGVAPSTTSTSQAVDAAAQAAAAAKAEQDRLAAIQAQLAAQAAAQAAQERADKISKLQGAIAKTENDQIQVLTQIRAVYNDNSRLQDYRNQYLADQVSSGRFQGLINACRDAVWGNCGGRGWLGLGRCPDDNWGGCDARQSLQNGYFKGSWNGGTDRNPWIILSAEADDPNTANSAPQRLAAWKKSSVAPLEAQLARLEVQYQGMVSQLRDQFGVSYQPQNYDVHNYKPTT